MTRLTVVAIVREVMAILGRKTLAIFCGDNTSVCRLNKSSGLRLTRYLYETFFVHREHVYEKGLGHFLRTSIRFGERRVVTRWDFSGQVGTGK